MSSPREQRVFLAKKLLAEAEDKASVEAHRLIVTGSVPIKLYTNVYLNQVPMVPQIS